MTNHALLLQTFSVLQGNQLHPLGGFVTGLAVSPVNQLIHAVDYHAAVVKAFKPNGHFAYTMGKNKLVRPWDIFITSNGKIAVSDPGHGDIKVFSKDGQFMLETSIGYQIHNPYGIAYHPLTGESIIADKEMCCVFVHNAKGDVREILGTGQTVSESTDELQAIILSPSYLCFDNEGNIYIADEVLDVVMALTSTGAPIYRYKGINAITYSSDLDSDSSSHGLPLTVSSDLLDDSQEFVLRSFIINAPSQLLLLNMPQLQPSPHTTELNAREQDTQAVLKAPTASALPDKRVLQHLAISKHRVIQYIKAAKHGHGPHHRADDSAQHRGVHRVRPMAHQPFLARILKGGRRNPAPTDTLHVHHQYDLGHRKAKKSVTSLGTNPPLTPVDLRHQSKHPDHSITRHPNHPDHTMPKHPDHTMPKPPDHAMLKQPDHTMPKQTDHTMPKQTDHTMSKHPDHTMPKQPDHTMPKPPDHTMPKHLDHTMPKHPDHTIGKIPDHPIPKILDHPNPKIPDHPTPKIPDHSTPKIPDHSTPKIPFHNTHGVHPHSHQNYPGPSQPSSKSHPAHETKLKQPHHHNHHDITNNNSTATTPKPPAPEQKTALPAIQDATDQEREEETVDDMLHSIAGICVDDEGNLLVADAIQSCVHLIDHAGNFRGYVLNAQDKLNHPQAITLDGDGNIVISEAKTGLIKVYQYKHLLPTMGKPKN